jgi:hypothetical protein
MQRRRKARLIWSSKKMSNTQYAPSPENVDIVKKALNWYCNSNEISIADQVIAANIQLELAKLFATIARCEAHEEDDVTFPLTEEGVFTDDFQYAVCERILIQPDDRHEFLSLLAEDLYHTISKNDIGGKWGFLDYSNGEIYLVIEIRRPTPTPRPDWVKATMF